MSEQGVRRGNVAEREQHAESLNVHFAWTFRVDEERFDL
jgi:hypothetical protein